MSATPAAASSSAPSPLDQAPQTQGTAEGTSTSLVDLSSLKSAVDDAQAKLQATKTLGGSLSDQLAAVPNPAFVAPAPNRPADDPRFARDRLQQQADARKDEMPPASAQPDATNPRLSIPAHSCCFGAPFPLNFQAYIGYYYGPDGSYNQVVCLAEVASDTPYATSLNYRYITYTGGLNCNYGNVYMAEQSRLYDSNGSELGRGPYNEGYLGTIVSSTGAYNRNSDTQLEQVGDEEGMVLPYGGTWTTLPSGCSGTGTPVASCLYQFFSPFFPFVPDSPDPNYVAAAAQGVASYVVGLLNALVAQAASQAAVLADQAKQTPGSAGPDTPFDDLIGDTSGVEDTPAGTVYFTNSPQIDAAIQAKTMTLQQATVAAPKIGATIIPCVVSFRRRVSKLGANYLYNFGGRTSCNDYVSLDGQAFLNHGLDANAYLSAGRQYSDPFTKNQFSGGSYTSSLEKGPVRVRYYANGTVVQYPGGGAVVAGFIPLPGQIDLDHSSCRTVNGGNRAQCTLVSNPYEPKT